MSQDICTGCRKPIADDDEKAYGPRGNMHYWCYKVGKMHGQQVTLPRCSNCNAPLFRGDICNQCGVGPRIGI